MTAWHDPTLQGLTFEVFLERLAGNADVEGLLLFGSSQSDAFSSASDYDLIIVLADGSPGFNTIGTWVDGHLTEINCKRLGELEALGSLSGVRDISEAGSLVNQIRIARIAFDRTGRLAFLQERLRELPAPTPPGKDEAYDWWFRVGYNLAHAKRYLSSEDPAYRLTAEVRMLYGIHGVFMAYFAARGIPWRGDKEAVKYLQAQDSAFLDSLLACMREVDADRKLALYEALAREALASVGEPWPAGTTMVELGDIFADGQDRTSVDEARAFWQQLIGETELR
jgi:hypothetical protein